VVFPVPGSPQNITINSYHNYFTTTTGTLARCTT
jgi:hypothetical protein